MNGSGKASMIYEKSIKRKWPFFLALLIMCLLAVSCGEIHQDELDQENSPGDILIDDGPVEGGELNIYCMTPDETDPLLVKKPSLVNVYKLVYEGLTKTGAGYIPEPSLAKSWYVSGDGLKWVFNLNEDSKWHDLSSFTAEDVVFTIDRIRSLGNRSPYLINISNIDKVELINDHTVSVSLKKPYFNTPLLMNFPIVQQEYYTRKSGPFTPGTGPYMIEDYEEGIAFTLEASGSFVKKPYITRVNVHIFNNMREVYDSFQKRELDIINCPYDVDIYTGKNDLLTESYISDSWELLAVNSNSGIFSTKPARQFLFNVIERESIIEKVYGGYASKAFFPVHPESGYYQQEYSTELERLQNFGVIEILVNEENISRIMAAELICDMLNENGLNARPLILPFDQVMARVGQRNYVLALLGMTVPVYPDMSFITGYRIINSSLPEVKGEYSPVFNLRPGGVDIFYEFFEKADKSVSDNGYIASINELTEHLYNEMPYIGLYFIQEKIVYNRKIRGKVDPVFLNIYNNIENWYILQQGDN